MNMLKGRIRSEFRRGWLLLCLVAGWGEATAQHIDDDYYPYAAEREERTEILLPDSTIFYRAIQSAGDLYARCADFNLPAVRVKRRGQEFDAETARLEGISLSYRYFAALRLLGAAERRYAGLAVSDEHPGGAAGIREFRFGEEEPLYRRYASAGFSDRNYRAALKFSTAESLGRGWSGSAALDARLGRDMRIEGVFTEALMAGAQVAKRFSEHHGVRFVFVAPLSVRGLRSASTEEAFSLVGDRLYNPSWGFQDGKVRNSHVRREFLPMGMVAYRGRLSPSSELAVAGSVEAGLRKYSGLGWYDARTPMPDNYRFMPSYTGDRETAEAWRRCDPRYTQIDWDELIRRNRLGSGSAVYALDDRVERLCNVHFDAAVTTDIGTRLRLCYKLEAVWECTRNYKQMRDLLGADYLADIDQYLIDDATYGNLLQNDLRHPNRTIREGDRFGYDYELVRREAGLRLLAAYRSDRLRVDVGLSLGTASIHRFGHYEKELFPGTQSYGRSRRMRFTPYTLKATAGWAFSPRSYLEGTLMAGAEPPRDADLFFQPQYNNRTVDDPAAERTLAAQIDYRFAGRSVRLNLSAFVLSTCGEMQSRRYYDDLSSTYCDMSVTGIGRMCYGVEAAAEVRLSYRWSLTFAASALVAAYSDNPRVTVLSDVDNSAVLTDAESFMGDCRTGGAPGLAAVAGVGYFGPKGWGFRASAGYAGRRYVEPMPLRRTERVARQAGGSRETFEAFTRQERLDDALTVDCSFFKSFYFGRSRLTASLICRNLLGDGDRAYAGYESLRVRRLTAGDAVYYKPHDTRYTYAYPRSFYLTVSYRF